MKIKDLPEADKQAMYFYGWQDEDEVPHFHHNIEEGPLDVNGENDDR